MFTHWQVESPAQEGIHLAVSLGDVQGYRWSQADELPALAYGTWRVGDQLIQRTRLAVPGDLVPGTYTVQVVLYHTPERPLPIQQGDSFLPVPPGVAEVALVPSGVSPVPTPPIRVEVTQQGPLRPLGAWEPLPGLVVDVPTVVHLSWQPQETLDTADLTFQVHGRDATGHLLWTQPLSFAAPLPATWPKGQVYRLAHTLQLPGSLNITAHSLRLEVCALNNGVTLGCAVIGAPGITQVDRLQAIPVPPSHPVEVVWGESMVLVGYDVTRAGDQLVLVLYWQVRQRLTAPTKQFIHLLDTAGAIVVQDDKPLAGRGLPPEAWVVGEYLVDTVRLSLPAEQTIVGIRLGLYKEADGARLPARSATGEPLADHSLIISIGE